MQEFLLCLLAVILSIAGCFVSYAAWANMADLRGKGLCLGGLALSVVVAISGVTIQYSVDRYQHLTFQEYYNGVETATEMIPTTCYKDGSCYYTYRCAPYTEQYTDSKGQTKTRPAYHYCPYVTEEDAWMIDTTVGNVTVAAHRLPEHYQAWGFSAIPASIIQEAGVGMPAEIAMANAAIARGDPRPATVAGVPYTNDILASDDVLLNVQSTDLDRYLKAKVLPPLSTTTLDNQPDQADKVHFVGMSVTDPQSWQEAGMRVNMEAASSQRPLTTRFDIQVVVVNDRLVSESDADDYTRALQAYWESPQYFGHGALPKNDEVDVVGTDGSKTTWARGFTLIPTGNGILWQDIQSPAPLGLVGVALTPQALIGWPRAVLSKPGRDGNLVESQVIPGTGAIEQVVINGPDHFVRQHITDHHFGSQGFTYLEGEIQPDAGTCMRIVLLTLLAALLLVNGVFFLGYKSSEGW